MFAEGDEEDEDGDGGGDDTPAPIVKVKGRKVTQAVVWVSIILLIVLMLNRCMYHVQKCNLFSVLLGCRHPVFCCLAIVLDQWSNGGVVVTPSYIPGTWYGAWSIVVLIEAHAGLSCFSLWRFASSNMT